MSRTHVFAAMFFCAPPLVSALWPFWPYLLLFMVVGVLAEGLEILILYLVGE